jgi:glycosyltransferase involved in cell wall biosynthesis
MNDRPLLSFVVSCYNQEPFIGEAIAGALAQTYSPLEIIISDDCSKDRTFAIAQETVASYRGPHVVRLNRNDRNLGIGGNVNRAMEFCHGELILLADGDDVSLPSRTEVTYQAWEQFGKGPTSVCLTYTTITREGIEQGTGGLRGDPNDSRSLKTLDGDLMKFLSTRQPAVCGCSHAWTPELFRYFGPLKSDLEDLVLSFRSLAIGKILHIQQPLVKYRRHGGNVSFFAGGDDTISFQHRENRLRWVDEQTVRAYDNMLADIEVLHSKGGISTAQRDRLREEGKRVRMIYDIERRMLEGSVFKKLCTLANAAVHGNLKTAARLAPRLLPRSAYESLYTLRNRMRASAHGNGSSNGSSNRNGNGNGAGAPAKPQNP